VTGIDWAVVASYFLFMLAVGLYFTRRASRSVVDYFVPGRNLPWRADLPPGFFPPQKLAQAIDAARRAHPEGIAILRRAA